MSVEKRALLIGMAGPAIQAAGFVMESAHLLVRHFHGAFPLRQMAFEPGILMIVVGFFVGVVCIPLAIEVARAAPEDLEIPVFGYDNEEAAIQLELRARTGS
jgi:hypothetical protein